MNLNQTVIVCMLIVAAVVAGALHLDHLSGVLAGAAAGMVAPTPPRPGAGMLGAKVAAFAVVGYLFASIATHSML